VFGYSARALPEQRLEFRRFGRLVAVVPMGKCVILNAAGAENWRSTYGFRACPFRAFVFLRQ